MSTNPLEKLVIDYWYKAVVVASIFILIISLTVNLVAIDNTVVQLISIGAFFIGIGEWINHPLQTRLMPASVLYPAGKITGNPRNPSFTGILFDILGCLLVGIGIYKLFS
jgi:hypothetical protein